MGTQAQAVLQQLGEALQFIFGGDFPSDPLRFHQAAARAVVVYLVGLAIVRIGKSRLIGRLTALDVILGFILGSLLSRGITGHASISGTGAACAAIVAAHWVLTLIACHSHAFGTLLKGHAHLIVKDGQPLRQDMNRSHVSDHDLEEELRLKGIEELKEVKLAFKERNGEVSVIKRKKQMQVADVAVQQGVQTVRIELEIG
jgi:uncharacterized membrane protein YcaP (DUF421 family)